MRNNNFLKLKEKAFHSFEKAKTENKVDGKIINLLEKINGFENFYTSSSCSGRIVVLEIPEIGDKKKARFLGKWHRKVNFEEINVSVKKSKKDMVWVLAQSPIIHIGVDNQDRADFLVKLGVSCGFKNSGIKSIVNKITVEICSTERLDAPVGKDGELFCDRNYLELLVELANDIIIRSDKKLFRLQSALDEYRFKLIE